MTETDSLKTCKKCGIPQVLDCFPFNKQYQTYRTTCKACRAAELRALRRHPAHAERIREAERVRSQCRRPAIAKWEHEHPDNMRPGRQRRTARTAARLAAARATKLLITPPDKQPPRAHSGSPTPAHGSKPAPSAPNQNEPRSEAKNRPGG